MNEDSYFTNIYPVDILQDQINIMNISYPSINDFKDFRELYKSKGISLYRDGETIFGYGNNKELLTKDGFTEKKIELKDYPRLTSRLILEGILTFLENKGYYIHINLGRSTVFNPALEKITKSGIKVLLGYDIRSIFLKKYMSDDLIFGLIVDIIFNFKDKDGNGINFHQIKQMFGTNSVKEIRIIQGDLIPTGRNLQVGKMRYQQLSDLLTVINDIEISNETTFKVASKPIPILLGGY